MAPPYPNRRRRILINKAFQFRYMLYICLPLLIVCLTAFTAIYYGIWADVLSAFTDQKISADLIAARDVTQYENVLKNIPQNNLLFLFNSAEKMSLRQQEIFGSILAKTTLQTSIKLFFLLLLIAFGSIFISHKIAGPFHRMVCVSREIENGNYKARVQLRKGDEGVHLAEQANKAYEATDKRLAQIKKWANEKDPREAIVLIRNELSTIQTQNLSS